LSRRIQRKSPPRSGTICLYLDEGTRMTTRTTWLDRVLQRRRVEVALRELPRGARVLDIGTRDGALFRLAGARGVGIDPELVEAPDLPGVTLVRGVFPEDLPALPDGSFDAVIALAVVEHVPSDELAAWGPALARLMAPHGRLVITVPDPAVDKILHVLMRLRLVAGMEAHQHHGFEPKELETIFAAPLWRRAKHHTFELGLNNLYLFERMPDPVQVVRPEPDPEHARPVSNPARQ
jgi:SAM-dependent methyltransferase